MVSESVQTAIVLGGVAALLLLSVVTFYPEDFTPVQTQDGIKKFNSYDEIKTSALQSRALAGVANGTYLFCLPGSSGACKTGWDNIIKDQLDHRTSPCNLTMLIPRLKEV